MSESLPPVRVSAASNRRSERDRIDLGDQSDREAVAAALAEHYATGGYAPRAGWASDPAEDRLGRWGCACGAGGRVVRGDRVTALHRAHLADAILPLLAAAREEGRAEGAAEVRALRFRVEVACDGYEALTDADVPRDVLSYEDYFAGSADAANAIRAALAPDAPEAPPSGGLSDGEGL